MSKKKSVCWNITSRCNENCGYCYRILCDEENSIEQNNEILKKLVELKIERITWTGGECLLYPHLYELLMEAHKHNIKNNLITNGKFLSPKKIDKIEGLVDYITFSLDSLDEDVNETLGRGKKHANHIIELLEYLEKKDIRVKLNSIVTQKNIESVKEVIEIVKKYSIERWKLFKFMALRGKSIERKEEFWIKDEEYNKLIEELKKENLKCPVYGCEEEEIQKYLLIDPIGNFVITTEGKDKIICNYKEMNFQSIKEFLKE